MSRSLTFEDKLPSRSHPEIRERYEDALKRQQRRKLKFRGKKLSGEALTNAIVMHFLDLGPEEQDRITTKYVARLDAMLIDPPAQTEGTASTARVADEGGKKMGRKKGGC